MSGEVDNNGVRYGPSTSEFWITIVTTLGCVAGGLVLLFQGKTQEGVVLLTGAAGGGGLYSIARGLAKR
jgi:hypothetical protein